MMLIVLIEVCFKHENIFIKKRALNNHKNQRNGTEKKVNLVFYLISIMTTRMKPVILP